MSPSRPGLRSLMGSATANNNSCPVCLESLLLDHPNYESTGAAIGVTVPCGHVFHIECFRRWERTNSTTRCPTCNGRTPHFQKLFLQLETPRRTEQTRHFQLGGVTTIQPQEGGEEYEEIISEGSDAASGLGREYGCFVYQVISNVSIRIRCRPYSVAEGEKVQSDAAIIKPGRLVSVDCIVHGQDPSNGPFLRLSDGSGWLFENKNSIQLMKRIPVQEGCWKFYASNWNVGIATRWHPVDRQQDRSKELPTYLPMQKIVCDRHVIDPATGVNFYRVEGISGWVFDRRGDRSMMISESRVKEGLFVYKVRLEKAAILLQPNENEASRTPFHIQMNDLAAGDIILMNDDNDATDSVFLRLTNGSGWIRCSGRDCERVSVRRGNWSFVVENDPVGIGLRRQPIDSGAYFFQPEKTFLPDEIIRCDAKVEGPSDVNFYRVSGTDGWVFDKRQGRTMLARARSPVTLGSSENEGTLSPEQIRRVAAGVPDLTEIDFNERSRVISFRKSGGVRINVYYTTGTVGTALEHPSQGRTQLFRRNCDIRQILDLLKNPRVHTGKGYYRADKRPRIDSSSGRACACNAEEEAVRDSVRALDSEIYVLQCKRDAALLHLQQFQKLEEARAKESNKNFLHFQKKVDQERKSIEAEKKKRTLDLVRKKRGDKVTAYMARVDEICLNNISDNIYAMGGSATIILSEDNGWSYTSGLPDGLHKLLHTRALSHPRPVDVALGSFQRYYVRFANGRSNWSGNTPDRFDRIVRNNCVKKVAFGSSLSSFVVFTDSNIEWNDVPWKVEVILREAWEKPIHSVSLGPSGEYFVAWKDGRFKGGGWSNRLNNHLGELKRDGWHVRDIKFGGGDAYLIRYSSYSGPF